MSDYFRQHHLISQFSNDESWVILSEIEQRIKDKIEKVGVPLKDWDINIYRGILTGFNEAFIINGSKRNEILANCQTENERQKTDELIRPLLRGRDIKRYSYDFADLYLICTFPSKSYDIDEFPAIKKFLEGFKPKLEQTGKKLSKSDVYNISEYAKSQGIELKEKSLEKSRKKTNNKWFETQDSISYWEEFSKQKIVYSNMCSKPSFSIDKNNFLTNQKCFILTGEKLNYLISFFNSKLFEIILWNRFPALGEKGRELSKIFMIEIPVIIPDNYSEKKIIELFNKEKYSEIDKIIYNLYNLTDEEIDFIEKRGAV